jgi:hypothetical protein
MDLQTCGEKKSEDNTHENFSHENKKSKATSHL